MSTTPPTITRIHNNPATRAMRHAVLGPLIADWQNKPLADVLHLLRSRWLSRLAQLRNAGWSASARDPDYNRYRDCALFGVDTPFTPRFCRHPMLCPSCWARNYVLKAYLHLEAKLTQRGVDDVIVPPDCVIAVHHYSRPYTTRASDEWDSRHCVLSLGLAMLEVASTRRMADYAKFSSAFGGAVFHAINPGHGAVVFRRATIALVPPRIAEAVAMTLACKRPATAAMRTYPATRTGLSQAVSSAMVYSPGLLDVTVNPIAVIDLLTLGHHHRMLSLK